MGNVAADMAWGGTWPARFSQRSYTERRPLRGLVHRPGHVLRRQEQLHSRRQVIEVLAQRVPVEVVDFRPSRRLAEFVPRDVEQGVALLDFIGPTADVRRRARLPA